MAERRVWVEGGNLDTVEGPMEYIGQGESRIWIEGGNIAITGGGGGSTFQGEWDNGTMYAEGDMVTYNQNLYIAIADGAANEPSMNNAGVYSPMGEYTPTTPVNAETGDIEIGIQFQVDQTCTAVASLFYKGDATNGGTHVGRIWDVNTATQLDSETYAGETASGWQRQAFATPITLTPGVNYIHSVSLPQAHYSNTPFLFRMGPFVHGPVRVGASLYNETLATMPGTIFNDTFYFNTIEVSTAANAQWDLMAKGSWGTLP